MHNSAPHHHETAQPAKAPGAPQHDASDQHVDQLRRPSIFTLLTTLLRPSQHASLAEEFNNTSGFMNGKSRPNRFIIVCTFLGALALLASTQLYRHLLFSSAAMRATDALVTTSAALHSPTLMDHVNTSSVLKHINTIQQIACSDEDYELTRSRAREYIRDYLVQQFGFDADRQILWNKFELQQQRADGRELITTRFTGINIMIWTNTTPVASEKVRVIGAHYDSAAWGRQGAQNATSEKPTRYGTFDNLSGAAMLMELAGATLRFVQTTGTQDQIPFLFVLFDHNKPSPYSIGSKSLLDFYRWTNEQIAYAVVVDSIGLKGTRPVIQTVGFEYGGVTTFTPAWLARLLLASSNAADAYSRRESRYNAKHVQSHSLEKHSLLIGNTEPLRSLMYQMTRYHLLSSRYLNDEGPFAWRDIPASLYTNKVDYIFMQNPVPDTIQLPVEALDEELLARTGRTLMHFVAMSADATLSSHLGMSSSSTGIKEDNRQDEQKFKSNRYGTLSQVFSTLALRPLLFLDYLLRSWFHVSFMQYLVLLPVELGFYDLIILSSALIILIYQMTFKKMRRMVRLNKEFRTNVFRSHRIVALHMTLMCIAVWLDPAFATVILFIGSIAILLVPVTKFHIGVISSFVCGVGSLQVVFFDVIKIRVYGMRLPASKELLLGALVTIYISHCLFVLLYSFDYMLKEIHLLRHRRATRARRRKQNM